MTDDKKQKIFMFSIMEITTFKLWYYSAIIGAGLMCGGLAMLDIFRLINNLIE